MRCLLLLMAVAVSSCLAAPPNPKGSLYEQPDGTKTPKLFLKGGPQYNWMSDQNDYTVLQDSHGWWVYAKKLNGELVSSGVRVGLGNPKKLGIVPNLKTDPSLRPISRLTPYERASQDHRSLMEKPHSGLCSFEATKDSPCRLKSLVVLFRFPDHKNRQLPAPEDYDILFNHNGPTSNSTLAPTGSVADVFRANSYDTFVMESHVTPWIDITRTEAETVDNNYALNTNGAWHTWKEVMTTLEETGFDFSKFDENKDKIFDCLVLLHSGVAAETGGTDCESGKPPQGRVWSHATSWNFFTSARTGISNYGYYVASGVWGTCPPQHAGGAYGKWDIGRIALIAHECAHFLGLPDLYDPDGGGNGAGSHALQANMWGWYGTQYMPPMMSAWSKYKMNWVKSVNVTYSGTYELKACDSNTVLLVKHNMPEGEYFLIENRWPCKFDADLKHHTGTDGKDRNGAAVWHIDESDILGFENVEKGIPNIKYTTEGYPDDGVYPGRHYRVALVQGDGDWKLERGWNRGDRFDLFRQSSNYLEEKVAYAIGPDGVTLNSGVTRRSPNTNSIAYGEERHTGISIVFGPANYTMTVQVILEGAPKLSDQTKSPTQPPTPRPTERPTLRPTAPPTLRPTLPPTERPTLPPTERPTLSPTERPTSPPTLRPTLAPTERPTFRPTMNPTLPPTERPTEPPTARPTDPPTKRPTEAPTSPPTDMPTKLLDPDSLLRNRAIAHMESFVTRTSDQWTQVEFHETYKSPVAVCTVLYVGSTMLPTIVRMRNVQSTSFEIRLQNPSKKELTKDQDVHCIVVEEGSWVLPDGTQIEAQLFESTVTDRKGSWVGQRQSYLASYYQTPVVLGSVMSYTDERWSVFWCRGSSKNNAPTSSTLFVGKHVGEDNEMTRVSSETLGFIVMEAGHGSMGDIEYEAQVGADIVLGYHNEPSFEYQYDTAFSETPMVAVVTQAGMDGGDGGWAVLSGDQSQTTLRIVVEEDQISNNERKHTSEQVSYIALTKDGSVPLTLPE